MVARALSLTARPNSYSTQAPPPSNNTANVAEPLPDVTETPNVILVKKQVTQVMNNYSETVEVNAVDPAATNFTCTPGAQLTSQEDLNILNGTNLKNLVASMPG
ncbi:hypothetical protein BY996DRAFT_6409864 [Phakopsora pachyrhizi]|nr:hypothetical protein BY996DRAFT_6409864 [Phakopsora pachyrhizi]